MEVIRKRLLQAVLVAGAIAGLLAIVALLGRWGGESDVEATDAGVGLDLIVTEDDIDPTGKALCGNPGVIIPLADQDACPSVNVGGTGLYAPIALNFDSDDDGEFDAILLKGESVVRIVARAQDTTEFTPGSGDFDMDDGSEVFFEVKSGSVDLIRYSQNKVPVGAPDAALDNGTVNTGSLTALPASTRAISANTISDADGGGGGGTCDAAADTCVNNNISGAPAAGDPDTRNPDGMAVVDVECPSRKTTAVVSASATKGGRTFRDEVTIVCAGPHDALSITTISATRDKAQSVIANEEAADNGADPDLLAVVYVLDSAGNLTPKQDVDCQIARGEGDDLADLFFTSSAAVAYGDADFINNGSDLLADVPDIWNELGQNDSPWPAGVKVFSVEADAIAGSLEQDDNGEVTVTCWVDKDGDDRQDELEVFAEATVRVAGPPEGVVISGPEKVEAGTSEEYTAQVTDKTGESVADLTPCTWDTVDPSPGVNASLLNIVDETQVGKVGVTLFTIGPGNVGITLDCKDASDKHHVVVNPRGGPPTNTPEPTSTPLPPTATNTPLPPTATNTPVPPTATSAPAKACGDVNDNGSVDARDAALILQFKAGLIDELDNPDSADVNGRDGITSVDAALILQLSAGLIDELTC